MLPLQKYIHTNYKKKTLASNIHTFFEIYFPDNRSGSVEIIRLYFYLESSFFSFWLNLIYLMIKLDWSPQQKTNFDNQFWDYTIFNRTSTVDGNSMNSCYLKQKIEIREKLSS